MIKILSWAPKIISWALELRDQHPRSVIVGSQPSHCSLNWTLRWRHMNFMYSKITGHSTVCLAAYAGPHQRNTKVRIAGLWWGGIQRSPVNSLYKGPVTREKVPFYDVIMIYLLSNCAITFWTSACHTGGTNTHHNGHDIGKLCVTCLQNHHKYFLSWQDRPVHWNILHHSDVTMSVMASQLTGVSIVYSTIRSGAN